MAADIQHPVAGRPLVSVIIPTYNRKDLLLAAIDSCARQTWPNLEIIVVDDGSTDGTDTYVAGQLAGAWHGRQISYHRQNNGGASAARNHGLSLAAGKYIQFLDSDDELFAEKIALQAEILERPGEADAAGCSCYGQIGPDCRAGAQNARIGIFCPTPREYVEQLSSRIVHGLSTPASLWRRSFLLKQDGWRTDISLGDDLEYHIRLLTAAKRMAFVERELFWVREHSGPRLSDAGKDREKMLSIFRTRKVIYETLTNAGFWNETTQVNFLGALRMIYANVLACGTHGDIREMENFIGEVASHPSRRWQLPALVTARRALGKKALLGVHKCFASLRG